MELRHLRYFAAVAEDLSFRRAARRLHVSHPSLSQQINDLENDLSLKLFKRNSRQVELTEVGRVFLAGARQTLSSAQKAVAQAQEVPPSTNFVSVIEFPSDWTAYDPNSNPSPPYPQPPYPYFSILVPGTAPEVGSLLVIGNSGWIADYGSPKPACIAISDMSFSDAFHPLRAVSRTPDLNSLEEHSHQHHELCLITAGMPVVAKLTRFLPRVPWYPAAAMMIAPLLLAWPKASS